MVMVVGLPLHPLTLEEVISTLLSDISTTTMSLLQIGTVFAARVAKKELSSNCIDDIYRMCAKENICTSNSASVLPCVSAHSLPLDMSSSSDSSSFKTDAFVIPDGEIPSNESAKTYSDGSQSK